MNWKKFGWSCVILGIVGEVAAAWTWWLITQGPGPLFSTSNIANVIADLFDSAGILFWLGAAVLVSLKPRSRV